MEAGRLDSLFPQEQLALFSLPDGKAQDAYPTGADACALHLACEFRRQYQAQGSPEHVSEDLETLCLACLLLIAEYKVHPHTRLVHELIICRDCLQTEPVWRRYDTLPFDICLQRLGHPVQGLEILQRNFTHGQSGVRVWMFTIGWFVRRHLTIEASGSSESVFQLLRNVEDTLGYWDRSLALCRRLYPNREAFWDAVALYSAERMPEQFAERIAWARQNMEQVEWHPEFMAREVQVRRVVDDFLLRLPLIAAEQ
jgi:hypothetical protein